MSGVVTAVVGTAVLGSAVGAWGASEAADAQVDAANIGADTQRYIFERNTQLNQPFYDFGKEALPGLRGYDAQYPRPSYEETVSKPMESWDYTQSPAYKAKYSLGMEELNKQLQARGLAASGVGANRASDLARRLTAEDYGTEREYRRASLADTYKNKYAENTDRYNRLLDQVKMATGASAAMGQAGNKYAEGIGESANAAGAAKAGFYAGIPNVVGTGLSTGLKAYDYGQNRGWWGGDNSGFPEAGTSNPPSQAQLTQYDSLYM